MGVPVVRMKLLGFAVGASFASAVGVLFAAKQVFINPESFTFMESIGVLAMVILGGMGSIPGAILGATGVTILNLQLLKGLSLWLNGLRQSGAVLSLPLARRFFAGQPAGAVRAGEVRAHGVRLDLDSHDDLSSPGDFAVEAGAAEIENENSKFEALNPKQIQMTKIHNVTKQFASTVLELLGFCLIWRRFVSNFDIRISDLVLVRLGAIMFLESAVQSCK